METFLFNTLMIFSEKKWLLTATSLEATTSVFIITDEKNCFSIGTPGYWRIPNFLPAGIIDKLKETSEVRSQYDIVLHVKQIKIRGTPIETRNNGFN